MMSVHIDMVAVIAVAGLYSFPFIDAFEAGILSPSMVSGIDGDRIPAVLSVNMNPFTLTMLVCIL